MITKTWNIGEYAKGGVITVEVQEGLVTIIGKNWDFSAGSTRDSDQSNAKPFIKTRFLVGNKVTTEIEEHLTDLTTYYYTSKIMDWIQECLNVQGMNLISREDGEQL